MAGINVSSWTAPRDVEEGGRRRRDTHATELKDAVRIADAAIIALEMGATLEDLAAIIPSRTDGMDLGSIAFSNWAQSKSFSFKFFFQFIFMNIANTHTKSIQVP